MSIKEVEIHEFTYVIEDVSPRSDGEIVYVPRGEIEPPRYVVTIRTDIGLEGHYQVRTWAHAGVGQIKSVGAHFLIGRDLLERQAIWKDLR